MVGRGEPFLVVLGLQCCIGGQCCGDVHLDGDYISGSLWMTVVVTDMGCPGDYEQSYVRGQPS